MGTLAADIQSNLLAYNQINVANLPANLNPFTASGRTLLNSQVGSAAANAAGIIPPWSGFNALWGTGSTVAQSLRPVPAVFDGRYHQWPGRPHRPLHLSLHAGEVFARGIPRA